jgi:hypothetical protein
MSNGLVVWEGESRLDGSPVVLIVTGLKRASSNRKTGAVLQSYILRQDVAPLETIRFGLDGAICGDCCHRSRAGGGDGSCYVNVGQGPRSVYACYERGGYGEASPDETAETIAASGLGLRLGSYGDPAAVPLSVWLPLIESASWRTGYTHAWRRFPEFRPYVMASVDSLAEAQEARQAGWAYFRVAARGNSKRIRGEGRCPASEESGRRVTCASCPIQCSGSGGAIAGRVIQAHGARAGRFTAAP